MVYQTKLIDKITNILKNLACEDILVHLDVTEDDHVGGFITSKSFLGTSQSYRQNLIWDVLEKNLKKVEIDNIIAIITMAPEEMEE